MEEGAVERGAALEEEALNVSVGEDLEDFFQIEVNGFGLKDFNFGAFLAEGFDSFEWSAGRGDDEEIVGCGADKLGMERCAEVGIEDDAEEGASAGFAVGTENSAAVGEGGVVGEDGADAGEDGVGCVTEVLDVRPGLGIGEPVGLPGGAGCGRWGKISVGGEGRFQGDERGVVLNEVGEGFVEATGRLLEDAGGDFDTCGAEFGDALSTHERIGIFCGDDYAGDPCVDESVGARGRASVVGTGFEGDVGGCTFGGSACLFESYDLGVVAILVEVNAFGDDLVVADENAAYLGVRAGEGYGILGELEGSLHEDFVLFILFIHMPALMRIALHDEMPAGFCLDGFLLLLREHSSLRGEPLAGLLEDCMVY